VQEVVGEAGFESPQLVCSKLPYLASPSSRHARVEEIVTFAVAKTREVERPLRSLPGWLADPRQPVPLLPEVAEHALALRVRGYVASLVDGNRSLLDIAARLADEKLLPPAEAAGIVRDYLLRLHDEAQLRPIT